MELRELMGVISDVDAESLSVCQATAWQLHLQLLLNRLVHGGPSRLGLGFVSHTHTVLDI